jgi:NADPH:quinone reductase-like Zn-dependent oxidoreductase
MMNEIIFQKALVANADSQWQLKADMPIPDPGEGEVLVQVEAVALNPSDVKQLDSCPIVDAICGLDLAGVVVKLGPKTNRELQVGDRVSAFVFGCRPDRRNNGAFAEYAAARADFCIKLPAFISFAEGASFNVGLMTCGLALKALGLIGPTATAEQVDTRDRQAEVLVHGGSTATGTLANQLLRIFGFVPVATCSPSNFALVERAGAEHVLDYKTPTCTDEIRRITREGLAYAFDCVGSQESTTICYGAIGPNGGRYTSLAPFPDRLRLRRRDVQPDWILGYSVFGINVKLTEDYSKKASTEDGKFAARWILRMESLIRQRRLRSHPIQIQPDGLRGILRDKELVKDGGISGKKLVYLVGDT